LPADPEQSLFGPQKRRPNVIDGFKGWKEGTKKRESFDVAFLIHGRIVKQI
jgi:hypothetical protein